jgi:hypothetical protein
MGRLRTLAVIAALVTGSAAAPVPAGLEVTSEDGVDFAACRTYAWRPGTPAARAEVQQWIVDAVDRELRSKGLRPVEGAADLHVSTVAYAQMESESRGSYVHDDVRDIGWISNDAVLDATGHLAVVLADPATGKPLWRAVATEWVPSKSFDDTTKFKKKIDKLVARMFARYPPS